MTPQPTGTRTAPVTALLARWRDGDQRALDELTPLIHGELKRLASARMRRERKDHTLQATALVNEAFLQLSADSPEVDWESRNHFLAIAARLMRRILIEHARTHRASRRGGGVPLINLEDAGTLALAAGGQADNLIDIDAALKKLEGFDPRKARVVELRYFGGLTIPEIASAIRLSTATAERELRTALAWLRRELS